MNPERARIESIFDSLERGDVQALERARAEIDGFPHGVDPILETRWISHAVDCGTVAAVVWMLGQGVEIDFRDDEGMTVLHRCLQRDTERHEVLAVLLAAGANLDLHGVNDWTALHMAAAWGDLEAVRMLLGAGADRTIRTRIDEFATPEEEARTLGQQAAAELIAGWPG